MVLEINIDDELQAMLYKFLCHGINNIFMLMEPLPLDSIHMSRAFPHRDVTTLHVNGIFNRLGTKEADNTILVGVNQVIHKGRTSDSRTIPDYGGGVERNPSKDNEQLAEVVDHISSNVEPVLSVLPVQFQ